MGSFGRLIRSSLSSIWNLTEESDYLFFSLCYLQIFRFSCTQVQHFLLHTSHNLRPWRLIVRYFSRSLRKAASWLKGYWNLYRYVLWDGFVPDPFFRLNIKWAHRVNHIPCGSGLLLTVQCSHFRGNMAQTQGRTPLLASLTMTGSTKSLICIRLLRTRKWLSWKEYECYMEIWTLMISYVSLSHFLRIPCTQ